jgi:hypothetical protein
LGESKIGSIHMVLNGLFVNDIVYHKNNFNLGSGTIKEVKKIDHDIIKIFIISWSNGGTTEEQAYNLCRLPLAFPLND